MNFSKKCMPCRPRSETSRFHDTANVTVIDTASVIFSLLQMLLCKLTSTSVISWNFLRRPDHQCGQQLCKKTSTLDSLQVGRPTSVSSSNVFIKCYKVAESDFPSCEVAAIL